MLELSWLAGLLEGEGSFIAGTSKYPITLVLIMTDLDIVQRVADAWGVKVNSPKKREDHHKQPYRCMVRCGVAADWMRKVYPWMGKRRREQIDKALASWKPKGQFQKLPLEVAREVQARWEAGERVKDLAEEYRVAPTTIYALRVRKHF